jgi:hypothetical protein
LHASGTFHVPTGAYRNLTATFIRYRDASRAHSRPFKGACELSNPTPSRNEARPVDAR